MKSVHGGVLCDLLLERVLVLVDDGDGGGVLRQPFGDGEADSAGAAGDQCLLAGDRKNI